MSATIIDVFDSNFQTGLATFAASFPLRDGFYDVGNYHIPTLTNSGPVPFTIIGGFQCVGDFTAGIIYDAGGVGSLIGYLAFKSNWSTEGYFYCNTLTSNPVIISWTSFGVAENGLQILSDGTVRVFHGGDVISTGAGVVSIGAWNKIEYIVTNGVNGNIYINGILQGSGTSGIAGQLNCVNFIVGRYALGGNNLDGYARNVKVKIPSLPALP